MRSSLHIALIGSAALISSCGLLGQKAPAVRNLSFASDSMGCLNGFAAKVKQYADGTIADSEWKGSMECVSKNLTLFKDFVEPTDAAGYSVEDMRAFVSRFLLTTQPVSAEVVRAGFELKAALLGGSTDHISPRELGVLLANLAEIKQITLDLLPYVRSLNTTSSDGPSDQDLIDLANQAAAAGGRLAALLPSEARASVSIRAVRDLISELANFGIEVDSSMDSMILAAKVLLVGGSLEEIEPDSWRELARQIGKISGPVLIALRPVASNEKPFYERREVVLDILSRVGDWMESSMAHHGGAWKLTLIDRVLDSTPARWMPYDREVLKAMLRPLAQKFLKSRIQNSLDANAVATVRRLADLWSRGQTHVNQIFARVGAESAPWQRVIDVAEDYRASVTDPQTRADLVRVISLIRRFRPLISQGAKHVDFRDFVPYSKFYLSVLNVTNLAAVHFLESYAAPRAVGVAGTNHRLSESDFANFFRDFLPLAGELKVLDPTVVDIAGKRFRDMDLFTLASDGDGYLSEEEVTYFLVYASSIGAMSKIAADLVVPHCPSAGQDPFGTVFVGVECFETHFFSQTAQIWDHFPQLLQFYDSRDAAGKNLVQSRMAVAARRYGDSAEPVGAMDIQGYAGLSHYVESLFARFDRDENGVFDLDEIMVAYPMFKRLLVVIGKLDPNNDSLIQAVFTYIVKYQKIPKQDLHFITWYLTRPFWSLRADRGAILSLIATASKPEAAPVQSAR